MTEQVFHMSKAYIKRSKLKTLVLNGTCAFWIVFGGSFIGFVKGDNGLFMDLTFSHFVFFAVVMFGFSVSLKSNHIEKITLDTESLLYRLKEKEVFTLYSDIERLVVEHFSNQKVKRIQCFYDKKSCNIEGFENMETISLILSQNVSQVRKKKVFMFFDSPLFPFIMISGIMMVLQMALLLIDGWFLNA